MPPPPHHHQDEGYTVRSKRISFFFLAAFLLVEETTGGYILLALHLQSSKHCPIRSLTQLNSPIYKPLISYSVLIAETFLAS